MTLTIDPPGPPSEDRRLARLHELMVLDTAPEPVFDRLVGMASRLCGVPISLVSLVDEHRQWFKAQTGLPEVAETPREHAFCAHAIRSDEVMTVPDAHLDPRFSQNPYVIGDPNVRFYAGAPLTLPTGERVGTLCVIDHVPRQISAEQVQGLQELAAIVTDTLIMRRDLIARALAARSEFEANLSASEQLHRAIVEEQTELISLAQADGVLLYANPAYCRMVGRAVGTLAGCSLYDFIDDHHRSLVQERIDWVLSTGEVIVGENRMRSPNGEERWVAWTNSLQIQSDGSKALRSVGRDITARRRAEQALRASQAFLRRTGRVAGVGGWELDMASSHITWSEETRRIHEVPDDYQPTLAGAIDFYAPSARPVIEAAVQHAIRTGQGWDLELPFITHRGRSIWVRAVGEVEREDGEVVRLVGAFQDITQRTLLQQQLAEREQFLRLVTDNLPVRVAYLDRDARYVFVNEAHCLRFGRQRHEILGRTRAELTQLPSDAAWAGCVEQVLAGHPQTLEFEEEVAGQVRRIESRLLPDVDARGDVRGFFATGIDITERSQAEQGLRVLTQIFDVSSDFVVQSDARGAIQYMNPAARAVVGLAPDAPLEGLNVASFNTAQTNSAFVQTIVPAVKLQGRWQGETSIIAKGGLPLPVSHLVVAHLNDNGRIERYSAVMRDISAEVQARESLARQSAMLHSVTEALPEIVSAVDGALRYRFVNSAFERWHGLPCAQVLGRSARDLLTAEEVEQSQAWAQRALAGETVHFERHYAHRPGQPTLSLTYVPLILSDGHVDGFVGIGVDITPHRQEQVRLRALAERDTLTGLFNRAGFDAEVQRSLATGGGAELALICIDLDQFKPVNDTYGHPVGDRLLQAVAARFVALIRPTDAAARLGGDEFAVLLNGIRDLADAKLVALKLLEAAFNPFDIDGRLLRIGASLGVAVGADARDGGEALMATADARLYRAKRRGRGLVVTDDAE
jgi:diguanylate cyclase (GGDEF)-like protein/PAS domain S-box-containing protein